MLQHPHIPNPLSQASLHSFVHWGFVVLALIQVIAANAQPPDTLWTSTFGGTNLDWFHDVKCTPDGGYVAVGETWSLPGHDVDWYVEHISKTVDS
jgi:hypothetical protein